MTLDDLKVSERGRIIAINSDGAIRRRLLDMGLTPNAIVTLVKKAPFKDPLYITVRDYDLSIRVSEAKAVVIERI